MNEFNELALSQVNYEASSWLATVFLVMVVAAIWWLIRAQSEL